MTHEVRVRDLGLRRDMPAVLPVGQGKKQELSSGLLELFVALLSVFPTVTLSLVYPIGAVIQSLGPVFDTIQMFHYHFPRVILYGASDVQ